MIKFVTTAGLSAILAMSISATAHAQGFGLPKIEFPNPSKTTQTSSDGQQAAGAAGGCLVGGGLAYLGVKELGGKFLRDQGYTGRELEQAAQMAAGLGCVVGGSAAVAIIRNMDEKSKQKQDEAWELAQANTGGEPVNWEGPRESGYRGTVSAEAADPLVDGTECITRKDYVVDGSGQDATVYNRYCRNDAGDFERIET